MRSFMQSASALTLAAALAALPVSGMAQQTTESTESDAERVVEEVVQETKEAAGEAAEAVDETVEQTGQAVESEETVESEVIVVEPEETEGETAETLEPAGEDTATITEMQVEPVEGAITLQDEDSMLTSDLLDAAVYNAAGEKVGDIDDAIVSLDGMVEGVVIGVGGFLGIGEKHVAVEMQQISVHKDEDGQPQLIIDTTREALEAAPDFVTAADQRAAAERLQAQQAAETAPAGGMATSDTLPAAGTTAPAEPAADPEAPATTD